MHLCIKFCPVMISHKFGYLKLHIARLQHSYLKLNGRVAA